MLQIWNLQSFATSAKVAMAEFAQKRANSAIATLALCAKLKLATYLHKANLMQIRFSSCVKLAVLHRTLKITSLIYYLCEHSQRPQKLTHSYTQIFWMSCDQPTPGPFLFPIQEKALGSRLLNCIKSKINATIRMFLLWVGAVLYQCVQARVFSTSICVTHNGQKICKLLIKRPSNSHVFKVRLKNKCERLKTLRESSDKSG